MLAVGTVVMNRRESGRFPRSICGVVGQANQFAPGALTTPMSGTGKARALRNADRVLAGARYPGMQNVMFFHTAGLDYPYTNMQYRLVAGGNAFYEKRSIRPGETQQTQLAAIARQQAVEPPMPPRRIASAVDPAAFDAGAATFAAAATVPLPPTPEPSGPPVGDLPFDDLSSMPNAAPAPLAQPFDQASQDLQTLY